MFLSAPYGKNVSSIHNNYEYKSYKVVHGSGTHSTRKVADGKGMRKDKYESRDKELMFNKLARGMRLSIKEELCEDNECTSPRPLWLMDDFQEDISKGIYTGSNENVDLSEHKWVCPVCLEEINLFATASVEWDKVAGEHLDLCL